MSGLRRGTANQGKRKFDVSAPNDRPTKRAKNPKKASAKDAGLDTEASINKDIARMDPELLADHLAQQTKRFNDDLSLIELEERRIPASAMRDTTAFEPERTLDQMPDFLQSFSAPRRKASDLSKAPLPAKAKGAPHTIVVTGAGLRAADVTRTLRVFQSPESTVAKLFAKHIKLDEAKDYVARTRMGIGVGTPKRISDLLDAGALSASKLERIVVDVSYIDQKKRGILDMKDLQPAVMNLLNRSELKERYGSGPEKIDLLLY